MNSNLVLWGETLRAEQLRQPREVAGPLFQQVCLAGVARATDEDLRRFLALVIYVLRQKHAKSHVALLTWILQPHTVDKFQRRDWRDVPSDDDLRRAKEMLRALEWGEVGSRDEQSYLHGLRREAEAAAARRQQIETLQHLSGSPK